MCVLSFRRRCPDGHTRAASASPARAGCSVPPVAAPPAPLPIYTLALPRDYFFSHIPAAASSRPPVFRPGPCSVRARGAATAIRAHAPEPPRGRLRRPLGPGDKSCRRQAAPLLAATRKVQELLEHPAYHVARVIVWFLFGPASACPLSRPPHAAEASASRASTRRALSAAVSLVAANPSRSRAASGRRLMCTNWLLTSPIPIPLGADREASGRSPPHSG